MATTNGKHTWTEWGWAQSKTNSAERYRLDTNERGQFRCQCRGFIFVGVKYASQHGRATDERLYLGKLCKHIEDAEQEMVEEQRPTKSQPPQAPADEAIALAVAMCKAAGLVLTPTKINAMAGVLLPRLLAGPPLALTLDKPSTKGLRLITFD